MSTSLDADLRVDTVSGPVLGRARAVIVDGEARTVHAWCGLPYATARRFAPAGPPPSWTAPRHADRSGPAAPQLGRDGAVVGEEEGCTTLDVVAPAGAAGLPVLLFVHGGAFVGGAASDYDGAVLAARLPTVVVTVSYRLGTLGFAVEDGPTPALTDLVAAVGWVGDHAAAFGGDPARVTLAGQSAGAAMVCSLMTTPAVRGRFRAAVVLSGAGWTRTSDEERAAARALAAELVADPRDAPAADLVRAGAALSARAAPGDPVAVPFLPVVDGDVLPRAPHDAVRAGATADVALWGQTCRDEMAMFRPDATSEEQARLTARWWEGGLAALAGAQVAGGGRVWTSRFDHAPALPPFAPPTGVGLGATHGADNACLWAHPPAFVARPLLGRPAAPMTATDLAVTAELHDAVTRIVHGRDLPWADGADVPGRVFGG